MKNYSSLKLRHPPYTLFAYGPPKVFFDEETVYPVPERSFLYYLVLLRVCQKSEKSTGPVVQMRAARGGSVRELVLCSYRTQYQDLVQYSYLNSIAIDTNLWWLQTPEGFSRWHRVLDSLPESACTEKEVMKALSFCNPERESALRANVELFAGLLETLGLLEKGIIT